jgi:ABC-2 type transport system permease protein
VYEDIDKYLAFFDIGLKDWLVYKWDQITAAIFRILTPLVMLAVWSAIYASSSSSTLGGFSLSQTYSYFFVTAVISLIIDSDAEQLIQSDVVSGAVAVYLTKPIKYMLRIICSDLPAQILMAATAGIPFAIIVIFLLNLTVSPQTLLMVLAEVIVGFAVMYSLTILVGMISFYVTNAGGIFNIAWTLLFFLGGGAMPLNFFPGNIGSILQFLPFQILLYTPASTLLGSITFGHALQNTLVAVVWCIVICALDYAVWKHSVRRLSAAGG